MKKLIINIALLFSCVTAIAQLEYPLKKNICNVDVSHPIEDRKDSVIHYTLTSIDSIIPTGDTIFKIEYFTEGWQFRSDTLYEYRHEKYNNGGYVMKGKKEGLWDISRKGRLFEEGTYRRELAYYYRNEFVAHFFDDPLHPRKKHYFLDDTVIFSVEGLFNRAYILDLFSADTMYFKITDDDCYFYIDDVLVDTMKLRDLNKIFRNDICGIWNTRKYRIIRDSVKNARTK